MFRTLDEKISTLEVLPHGLGLEEKPTQESIKKQLKSNWKSGQDAIWMSPQVMCSTPEFAQAVA